MKLKEVGEQNKIGQTESLISCNANRECNDEVFFLVI